MALKNRGRKATRPIEAVTETAPPITPVDDASREGREHLALVNTATTGRKVTRRDPNDELLKPEQVAEEFGISQANLATWRTRGGGPPFLSPRPRVIRYRRGAILEWLGAEVRTTGEVKARLASATN